MQGMKLILFMYVYNQSSYISIAAKLTCDFEFFCLISDCLSLAGINSCFNIYFFKAGKHEAIVKNVHDLLAKLAWDFSPEQLDHLFECFQVCCYL